MSAIHSEQTGTSLHVAGYRQNSDPGAVGAGMFWTDTSAGTGLWILKQRNATNDGWEEVGSASASNAVLLTGDQSVAGVKTFSSSPIVPTPDGVTATQAVNVAYLAGFTDKYYWQSPVLAMNLTAPPGGETLGDRYIVASVATGAWATHENDIAEWDGAAYLFYTPQNGWTVMNQADSPLKAYTFNSTTSTWVQSGAASQAYTASTGVKLVANDFEIDLSDTNPSLEVSDGGVRARVDDSSIERAAGGLQVKALGITNAMLAGSIADTKLLTISTAGKVSGAALTLLPNIPGAAGLIPSANLGTGGAGGGLKALMDNQTFQTVSTAASTTAIQVVYFLPYTSAGMVWTNMPAASTELFGIATQRIKIDLTTASQYRLFVWQGAAGYAGSDFNLQYSTDNITFLAADTAGAGELDVGTGTGYKIGSWASLVAGAQADVWLRIVGKQGNGTVDPSFRQIAVEIKIPGGSSSSYLVDSNNLSDVDNADTAISNLGLASVTDSASGADKIGMTVITETGANATVQSIIEALITRLKAITDSASGADLIGATAVAGVTGETVQAIIEWIAARLQAVTDSASGADFVGATTVAGVTGTTVQSIIEWIAARLQAVTDSASGADFVGMTAITETGASATVQAVVEALITRLKATTDSSSGADLIGATAIAGWTGGTVQAILESAKTETHTKHFRLTVDSPNSRYTASGAVVPIAKLDTAITVTNIEVSCDADPTTEAAGDLKWADALIGLANAAVINDFDTTNGVRSDSTITSGAVASGKVVYLSFDSAPDAATKWIHFDITYTY